MPMPEAAIDNDVLIKAAAYDLLDPLAANAAAARGDICVLGAAPYVCRDAVVRRKIAGNRAAIQTRLAAFFATVEAIEPTEAEVALAIEFEEAALKGSLSLDSGESQLAAVLITRNLRTLVTGDKRAITALAKVVAGTDHAKQLEGRVCCFEQAMLQIAQAKGCVLMRTAVCAEPDIDRAIAICFSCKAKAPASVDCEPCLQSYIKDVRANSAGLLAPIG